MAEVGNYLWGVVSEGLIIGFFFWLIVYITVEKTSLFAAVKVGLISETIGNLPYLFGEDSLGLIALMMAVVGAIVFVQQILRVGELTLMKASYGILTTYFLLVAVVACNVQ